MSAKARASGRSVKMLDEQMVKDMLSGKFLSDAVAAAHLHMSASAGNDTELAQALGFATSQGHDVNQIVDSAGRSPLIYAVLTNSIKCVEVLLQNGSQPQLQDVDGHNAFHWSACHGRDRIIGILAQFDSSWSVQDHAGITALHYSVLPDTSQTLSVLLSYVVQSGGSPDFIDSYMMTPLLWAAQHNHPKHLQMLLKAGSDVCHQAKDRSTALHFSCSLKDGSACARLLVKADPSITDILDEEDQTALHRAVANEATKTVQAIAKIPGANLDTPDRSNRTPLQWACVLGFSSIADVLLSRKADDAHQDETGATALHYAVQGDHVDYVKSLLKRKRASDLADVNGRCALQWAVAKSHLGSIQAMVPKVDVNKQDEEGRGAIHIASQMEATDTLKLLLKTSKTNVNLQDSTGQTPLMAAVELGRSDNLALILKRKPNLEIADGEERTALTWAAVNGELDCLKFLLHAGSNIEHKDQRGETPLHYACFFNKQDCASQLLGHSADYDAQDRDGVTPLHWACLQGWPNIAKMLLHHGANPNMLEFTDARPTPLDHVLRVMAEEPSAEHQECLRLLEEHGAKQSFIIQEDAALKIQSVWRGHSQRSKYTVLRRESESAAVIQRAFRRHSLRQQVATYQQRNNAAKVITTSMRRFADRQKAKGESYRDRQAAKIQAQLRGYATRKKMRTEIRTFKREATKKMLEKKRQQKLKTSKMARQDERSNQALQRERALRKEQQQRDQLKRSSKAKLEDFQRQLDEEKQRRLQALKKKQQSEMKNKMKEKDALEALHRRQAHFLQRLQERQLLLRSQQRIAREEKTKPKSFAKRAITLRDKTIEKYLEEVIHRKANQKDAPRNVKMMASFAGKASHGTRDCMTERMRLLALKPFKSPPVMAAIPTSSSA